MVRPAVAAVVTGLDEGQSLGPLGLAAVAAGLPMLRWDTEKPAPSTRLVTAKWHLISGSLFPESGRLLSGLAPPPITCIECGRLPAGAVCHPALPHRPPASLSLLHTSPSAEPGACSRAGWPGTGCHHQGAVVGTTFGWLMEMPSLFLLKTGSEAGAWAGAPCRGRGLKGGSRPHPRAQGPPADAWL